MMIRRLMAPLTLALALALAVAVLMSADNRASGLEDPVLYAAGDIASCTSTGDEATAKLIDGIDPTVAVLGDNAYDYGTSEEFAHCYDNYKLPSEGGGVFDPARNSYWGQYKALTKPAVGNHEYDTPDPSASSGASGYYKYFGDAASPTQSGCTVNCKGYYSYDLGAWHVVVLNSNCAEVSCAAGSTQEQWLRDDLRDDLAAHPNGCTLAYWHHPRFTSARLGNNSEVAPFWQALYEAGAEVVLSGHAHNYERFAPQRPDTTLDEAKGIREFVVGTGGKSLNSFPTTTPAKNSLVRNASSYGVLKLTLHPGSYEWRFIPVAGKTFTDPLNGPGSGSCHGAPNPQPTGPPTVTNTVPESGAMQVSPTTDVTATFSEDMNASTITTTTFKLKRSGTTTNIDADVSYNATTRTATLNPTISLGAGTYKAVVTVGAKDLQGTRLDQNSTKTGSQQKAWSFTVSN